MRSRSLLMTALFVALAAAPALPTVAAAGPSPAGLFVSVEARLGRCALGGMSNPGLQMSVVHASSAGTTRATYDVAADIDGRWSASCFAKALLPGDTLRFIADGDVSPFRTFTIPRLRLVADRVDDRLSGRAPGVPSVELVVRRCGPMGLACETGAETTAGTHPTTKEFSWDLDGLNAQGGWQVSLTWRKGVDIVYLVTAFPFVSVTVGTPEANGDGAAFLGRITLALRRGDRIGTTNPRADRGGYWYGLILRNGTPMKVKPGDLVTADVAPDVTFTVPPTTILMEPGGGSVTGTCFKNGRVVLRARDPKTFEVDQRSVTASPAGAWGSVLTYAPGSSIAVHCANRKGDVVSLYRLAP